MLEEDETGVNQAGISGNVTPVVDHLSRGSQSSSNGEVYKYSNEHLITVDH